MKKEYIEITKDLMFPEGPIAMPDGSIILVEIARGTLTQVHKNGSKDIIAELGGGPNGGAKGPDGCVLLLAFRVCATQITVIIIAYLSNIKSTYN